MSLLFNIRENAKRNRKRIVLPEGTSERTLKAADIILREGIADLILLGDIAKIKSMEKDLHLDLSKAQIIEPKTSDKFELYAQKFCELRKSKGISIEEARKTITDEIYYGTMMVYMKDADGEVCGAEHSTPDTVRPALQIVKTKPGISVVSGAMVMVTKNSNLGNYGIFIFADIAITVDPTAEQMAEIAICSAETAQKVAGITNTKIAMLSFSTMGSASHESSRKVAKAVTIANAMRPDLQIEGEMQLDAAIIESVGKRKAPNSKVAGEANVLIFPDLNSGNIGYKLVERLGNAEAIGPILQGLGAPINDLSRGCSVEDIVNLVAITSNQVEK